MKTDPLTIMNAICRWPSDVGTPPQEERWRQKIEVLCEYAAALKDLYALRTAQYRARCQGVLGDSKRTVELMRALDRVDQIERALGLKQGAE